MVSCDEFCRVKTQYNSKILGITCEGELSVYAQSNLCEKWDITHIIIGHQLNGQQLEPEVNLAKKVKYTQAMADELSRDTVLWGLSYEGRKNTQLTYGYHSKYDIFLFIWHNP